MPTKKRKISDLTVNDANTLLLTLNEFHAALDEDDEDLPSGLITALDQFRTKLEVVKVRIQSLILAMGTRYQCAIHQHVTFSKGDALVLLQVNIKSGPLFLVPETRASAEERGLAEIEGKALSMGILKELIELVRRHVIVVVSRMA